MKIQTDVSTREWTFLINMGINGIIMKYYEVI